MTLELEISLLSAFAAAGSAYWAWSSARTAKRALTIAEDDANSKKEDIKTYLINSLRWDDGEANFVSFAVSYTNGSNSPNTIARVELIIYAFNSSGHGTQILLLPVHNTPENSEFSKISIPLNLPPRTSTSGWLTFQLPSPTVQKLIIDRYEISATTWSGGRVGLDSYLVMKRTHADAI